MKIDYTNEKVILTNEEYNSIVNAIKAQQNEEVDDLDQESYIHHFDFTFASEDGVKVHVPLEVEFFIDVISEGDYEGTYGDPSSWVDAKYNVNVYEDFNRLEMYAYGVNETKIDDFAVVCAA